MPSTGTGKAKAKVRTKEKEKAKASGGAQHANLLHTIQTHVGTTKLRKWTLIQENNKNNFNANFVGRKGILHRSAENSDLGKINEIHRFNGSPHGIVRLQKIRQPRRQQLQHLSR